MTQASLSRALLGVAAALGLPALGQEAEPRAYQNAPVGVNFLIAGYGYTDGGLAFDPSAPLKDPHLRTNNLVLAYARVLDLWGKSAKVDIIAPYGWLDGTARMGSGLISREVDGWYDPKVRLSVNLVGAPALGLKDYARYQQDLLVGVSLQVGIPAGQYDRTRLVNIGLNRWFFKPEVGVAKTLGRWTMEGRASATIYTDNDEFYGGVTRSQEALYTGQASAVFSFHRGMWAALDLVFFTGGRTTVGGTLNNDRQENWRAGGTFALPLSPRISAKLTLSDGVSSRTGNDIFMGALGLQYRWGGGM